MTKDIKKVATMYSAEGALMKSVTAEETRLKTLSELEGCKDAFVARIEKDVYKGDKKRQRCIAIDEDNSDVNEC